MSINPKRRGRRFIITSSITDPIWFTQRTNVRYLIYNPTSHRGYLESVAPVSLHSLGLPDGQVRFLDQPRHTVRQWVIGLIPDQAPIIEHGFWQPAGQGNRTDLQPV